MKILVTLYSVWTEMVAHSSQINSSSAFSVARLFRKTMYLNVPHKKKSQVLTSGEEGEVQRPIFPCFSKCWIIKAMTIFQKDFPRKAKNIWVRCGRAQSCRKHEVPSQSSNTCSVAINCSKTVTYGSVLVVILKRKNKWRNIKEPIERQFNWKNRWQMLYWIL